MHQSCHCVHSITPVFAMTAIVYYSEPALYLTQNQSTTTESDNEVSELVSGLSETT